MPTQTVLPVDNARDVSLNNFFGAGNQALVVELAKLIAGDRPKRVLYLWGKDGSGKSHLLNACCHEFAKSGKQPAYIALAQQGAEPGSLQP